MIAFVLSGGGPRGALQAGALQVLLEKGIRPDLLVGTSAGAINATYLAIDPTPGGTYHLAELWQRLTKNEIYPGGVLRTIWRVLSRRPSLYENGRLRSFLERHVPAHVRSFGHMTVRAYVVATDLLTGLPYVFGDDADDPILDALMASSALPPVLPPWSYRGRLLVDGAVTANLPLGIAIEKGATEIYALETSGDKPSPLLQPNVVDVASRSVDALVGLQRERDRLLCEAHPEVTYHHLLLSYSQRLGAADFGHAAALIAEGRQAATAYLAETAPALARRGWRHRMRRLQRQVTVALIRQARRFS